MISDSEKEDFEAAILEAGFEVDDFNAVPLEDDEPTAIEQYAITGTVTVHRISTDDEAITYSAGHLSAWVKEFEADLQAGVAGAFERKGTVWKAAKPQSVGKQQLVLRLHDYTRVARPRIGQLQTIENADI